MSELNFFDKSKKVKTIKHRFKESFIPLANPPVRKAKKVKKLDPILRCCKNKKALNKMGIFKDKEIRIALKRTHLISFYDDQIKQIRYISLSPKLMKYFKEVK